MIFWPDKPARLVAKSFRESPGDWRADGYIAKNEKTKTVVWIANASFGLEVTCDGAKRYGFFFPVGTVSQIWIWMAYRRWSRNLIISKLEANA